MEPDSAAASSPGAPRRRKPRDPGFPRVPGKSGTAFVPIETKLLAPVAPPGCLRRPHLAERLRAAPAKLILVGAPTGYGKTTLLAEWRETEQSERAFAWVCLDRGDADPTRFWSYVVEAVRRAQPGFGKSVLSALRTPGADL